MKRKLFALVVVVVVVRSVLHQWSLPRTSTDTNIIISWKETKKKIRKNGCAWWVCTYKISEAKLKTKKRKKTMTLCSTCAQVELPKRALEHVNLNICVKIGNLHGTFVTHPLPQFNCYKLGSVIIPEITWLEHVMKVYGSSSIKLKIHFITQCTHLTWTKIRQQ